jgi:hypothetical protein
VSDPYEHGFEVAQRRRLDLPVEPPPQEHRRWQRPGRLGWQVVVAALGVVALLAIGRAVTARNATGLKPNCSRLALAVAEKTVQSHGPALLHWAATGPKGTKFIVAIEPSDGLARAQVSPDQVMPGGCLAHGQFGVLVPPGDYDVVLMRLDGKAAQQVAHRPVTVTGR